MRVKVGITAVVGLYLAAAFQTAITPRISFVGISPDFVLAFVAVFAMFVDRLAATITGFFGGVLQGALAGVNTTHYVITRTLTGFLTGSAKALGLEPSLPVAILVTAIVTAISQVVLFFLAPPSGMGRFLGDTIGAAMYNGVLAIPVYALLRRILASQNR